MKKILLSLLILVALPAAAWDIVGHRIIADIAYHNLTPEARQSVDRVLGFERAIVATSSWPDDLQNDTIYPGQNVWHYQDIDGGKTDEEVEYLYNNKKAEGYHLFFAKDSLIKLLEKDPSNGDALKFVVHFSGDEYQPMHMGHHDDLGGNLKRFSWFGQHVNLHSLWDGKLIAYSCYSSTEYCDYLMQRFAARKDEIMAMDELDCIKHTYRLSTAIYDYYDELLKTAEIDNKGNARFRRNFEYGYAYRFRPDVDFQLYMAGIQLAKLLNTLYH
ncbi:MAG: S1/P1 nuclease [Bacteroidales bacterium]|nr:S1/P1 nuclease [Candidatus Sodaliphilus aphodohippi]